MSSGAGEISFCRCHIGQRCRSLIGGGTGRRHSCEMQATCHSWQQPVDTQHASTLTHALLSLYRPGTAGAHRKTGGGRNHLVSRIYVSLCIYVQKIGSLILRKVIKIVATRCRILRLKCTKLFVGWRFVPDPAGSAYSTFPHLLAGF